MKKLAMTFVTILIVTVFAASAFAFGPSWQNGNRYDNRGRYEPAHFQYNNHPRQDYHRQKVVYVPVHPAPVVHVPQYSRPGIAISIPYFSLWIR